MTSFTEIQLVAAVVAAACALPGVFLVLRESAMLSDAISHSVLLGIVVAFFVAGTVETPLMLVGAAATGVLTVWLVELLQGTRLVKSDAAIGLVFPLLFAIAVILIARGARNVHLDTDAVLLGELAFAPLNRFRLGAHDLGPRALWVMGGVLLLNLAFIAAFYKELKLATFDPALAESLGFRPRLMHYLLMALVSLTAVGAFDAVGSVLVVALMVAPPAAAYLLTHRLGVMLPLAVGLGVAGALAGHRLALRLDSNIAGAVAATQGLLFAAAWLLAPGRGLLAQARRHARQRLSFREQMLLVHLLHHQSRPEAPEESAVATLHQHLGWPAELTRRVLRQALSEQRVAIRNGQAELTADGLDQARRAVVQG